MPVVLPFLDPAIVWVSIPVVAIIVFGTIVIVKSVIQHRERMAKIGMGIDPDDRPISEQMQRTRSPL